MTGSHPLEALKPVELQPGLVPTVTSLNTSGWAYRIGFTATHKVSYGGLERGVFGVTKQGDASGTSSWVYGEKNELTEAESGLVSLETLLVDQREDGTPDGRRQRRATNEVPGTAAEDKLPVADSADVGIRAAEAVVHALPDVREVGIARELAVAGERKRLTDGIHVRVHVGRLPRREREDVAEAAAAGEPGRRHLVELLVRLLGRAVREPVPLGAADRQDVGARAGEVGVEDLGAVGLDRAVLAVAHAGIT